MTIVSCTKDLYHQPIPVGTIVWVVVETYKPTKMTVTEAKVESQEWWPTNKEHPVYYNLVNPVDGKIIGTGGTGNWHFSEIFTDKAVADSFFPQEE